MSTYNVIAPNGRVVCTIRYEGDNADQFQDYFLMYALSEAHLWGDDMKVEMYLDHIDKLQMPVEDSSTIRDVFDTYRMAFEKAFRKKQEAQ